MKRKQYYRAVYSILVYFAVSFFSLCLIPVVYKLPEESRRFPELAIGLVFWACMILGFRSIRTANRKLRPLRRRLAAKGKRVRQRRVGIMSFTAKISHLIVYAIGLCGLGLILTDLFTGSRFGDWMFPIISVTLFSIALHGVIDGRNYKTLKLLEEYLEDRHEKDE